MRVLCLVVGKADDLQKIIKIIGNGQQLEYKAGELLNKFNTLTVWPLVHTEVKT